MQVTASGSIGVGVGGVGKLLGSLRAARHFDKQTAKQILTAHDLRQTHVNEVYDVAKQKHSLDYDVVRLCLSYYSRNGNARSAHQLIEKAKADGIKQHNSWYGNLAGALAVDGDIPGALHTLKQANGSVNPHTFPTLVTKLSTPDSKVRGYVNQFFKIIRDTVEKPEKVYAALMSQFAKAGDTEICTKLYKEMKKQEVEMGVGIYNALIDAHRRKGDMANCMMLLKEMKENNIKPVVYTYNVMIDGFGKLGDLTSCQTMIEEMKETGLKPSACTYNSMIGGYAKMGDLFMCDKIHKSMKEEGVEEDLITYKLLLRVHGQTGKVKECEALFKEMQMKGIQPDEMCLDIMQKALGMGNFRQRILVRGWLFAAFLPHLLNL